MLSKAGSNRERFLIVPLLLLVLSLALGLSACGGDTEDEDTTTTEAEETTTTEQTETTEAEEIEEVSINKIAVVAPEEGSDYGWNQQGVESAEAVAQDLGSEIEVADGAGYGDISPILRELAEGGSDLTFAHASGYGTTAVQMAAETEVPHVIIGQFEAGLVPGLAQDVETYAQDGSYLAGIVAANMTKSGTVGVVISADDENWIKMAGGFVQGAKSVDGDIDVLIAQIGQAGYADAAGGKRVTNNIISGGADVVFGMGDGSSFGMIQAVETATPPEGADKVWFIDVIGDKTEIDENNVLLTSVVWDYSVAFSKAVAALKNGTFGEEIIWLGLDGEGIDLLKTGNISTDVWSAVEDAKAGIIDGSIEVTEAQSKAELEEMAK